MDTNLQEVQVVLEPSSTKHLRNLCHVHTILKNRRKRGSFPYSSYEFTKILNIKTRYKQEKKKEL